MRHLSGGLAFDSPESTVTLASLLVTQFRRTPAQRAVSDEHEALTYRDLDLCSEALAGRLMSKDIGADDVVAIHLERSVDLAVAIAGVIRAGGAWLPLSTTDPAERVRAVLEESAPKVIITEDASRLPFADDASVFLAPRGQEGRSMPVPRIDAASPRDLAYVIYTSGSTGRPKGVMTEHAAIVNRLVWMQERFRLGPLDAVAQKTPYTFDVSVWELIWPLMTGAELVFAAPGGHRDPAYLVQFLEERNVTIAHFVPSMLAEFLRWVSPGACPRLRSVMTSGEALSGDLARRFFTLLPHAELHNLYGPTEAAIDVTHWQCQPGVPPAAPVPIGHPIADIDLHVLGDDGAEVPQGEVGELYIAGVGVARGYLNRPDLTAERFCPDPARPGQRMYRTGDLASRRVDGAYLYHGRNDRQVKVGGVRIELGDVESGLLSLPYVQECVVVTRTDGIGLTRLSGRGAGAGDVAGRMARRPVPSASRSGTARCADSGGRHP